MTDEPVPASSRRTRARRGEGEKLRAQILEAASRLLVETGDEDAVSIRAVADAVGVTPPSIYLHFADKNDLMFAICERYMDDLDRATTEATAASDDPLERIVLSGKAYVRFGLDHREPYRVIFMRKPTDTPLPWQQDKIMNSSVFGHLRQNVAKAMEEGLLGGDPLLVSVFLWATCHGLTSLLISKPNFPWPDRDALIDHVTRSAIRGVTAPA